MILSKSYIITIVYYQNRKRQVSVFIVLYIDGTFLKKGIPIRPVYSKFCTPYCMLYHVRYRVHIIRYSNLCGSSCGILQKEGAGIQGTWRWDCSAPAWCSLGKGNFHSAVNDIGWMLYHIRYRPPIFYGITFDIEREKDLRYRIRYPYAISNNVRSISKAWNLNIHNPVHDLWYRSSVTFDIEQCDLRYWTPSISIYNIECKKHRYRMSIRYWSLQYRMLRSISKVRHSISGRQGSRWGWTNPFENVRSSTYRVLVRTGTCQYEDI